MEFTIQHFIALAPLLITSLTIVVVMLAIAWRRNHSQTFLLSCAGLNLALLSIIACSCSPSASRACMSASFDCSLELCRLDPAAPATTSRLRRGRHVGRLDEVEWA